MSKHTQETSTITRTFLSFRTGIDNFMENMSTRPRSDMAVTSPVMHSQAVEDEREPGHKGNRKSDITVSEAESLGSPANEKETRMRGYATRPPGRILNGFDALEGLLDDLDGGEKGREDTDALTSLYNAYSF